MVGEREAQFDNMNLSLMKAMQALAPKSHKFFDFNTHLLFLSHYCISPVTEVETEVVMAKQILLWHSSN